MSITIRPITQRDQRKLAQLIRSVFKEYRAPLENTVYDDLNTWHIYDSLQGVNAQYWVIDNDGEIVGGCGFYPTEGLPDGYAELVKFYFSPKIRGLGFGSRILRQVIEEAQNAGYEKLYIESFPEFSAAIGIYLRHGFYHIPERLGNSTHTATSIFMLLDI